MAAELRSSVALSVIGMAAVAVVLFFVKLTFTPLVRPPMLLDVWLLAMAGVVGACAISTGLFVRRAPRDEEAVKRWKPLGAAMSRALNILVAASPWILLPHAGPALLEVMMVLYVWYVATAVMVSTVAIPISAAEVAIVFGSLISFLLWTAAPSAKLLAFFLGMIGLSMIGLRSLVRRAVVRAIEERLVSERVEAALRLTLAATAAERDAKNRFIASASHDLQQPLHAAGLFFETAVGTGDAGARTQAIAGARRAFASTQALIGQMLDYLRLEAGAVTARAETVALGPLLESVTLDYDTAARQAGMRLRQVSSRLAVTADANLLSRALGNMVANAVRHARGRRVLIGARRNGGMAVIWVIDDGGGVAAGDLDRVFEDFAQGSETGGTRGGFGLVLASARRSLDLMGGTAGLDRRWRGGSAFYLRLPLAEPQDIVLSSQAAEPLCAAV